MIQPIAFLIAVSAIFLISNAVLGYDRTYAVGYGAFALMAAMVSVTFLWLWVRRATPLAIGMFFGWGGAASVMAWWWMYALLGHPVAMVDSPLLFLLLSVYFVGAILHFKVIATSFGIRGRTYLVPVGASLLGSVAVQFLV